jgi:hypothetical protein
LTSRFSSTQKIISQRSPSKIDRKRKSAFYTDHALRAQEGYTDVARYMEREKKILLSINCDLIIFEKKEDPSAMIKGVCHTT